MRRESLFISRFLQMRPAKSVTFLLLLLLVTVQGIRLNGEFISAVPSRIHQDKIEDESGLQGSRVHERQHKRPPNHHCRSSSCSGHHKYPGPPKKSADQGIPSLQADYYGPRIHDPRHH